MAGESSPSRRALAQRTALTALLTDAYGAWMTASPAYGTLFDALMALRHETGGLDLDPYLPSREEPDRVNVDALLA